jgi:hypothetical protein
MMPPARPMATPARFNQLIGSQKMKMPKIDDGILLRAPTCRTPHVMNTRRRRRRIHATCRTPHVMNTCPTPVHTPLEP